jgi:choline trimethylamine-lyase activating enzyme
MDPEKHFEQTGVRNEIILQNLKELFNRRYNIRIRMPLLNGVNESKEEIEEIIKFLTPYKDCKNFKGIDLLPYHKFGVNKYNQLGMEYPVFGDPSLSDEELERIENSFKNVGIPVTLVKH